MTRAATSRKPVPSTPLDIFSSVALGRVRRAVGRLRMAWAGPPPEVYVEVVKALDDLEDILEARGRIVVLKPATAEALEHILSQLKREFPPPRMAKL